MTTEKAKELKVSTMWSEFCKEVDVMIDHTHKLMETATPDKVVAMQERIKALREVKLIPQNAVDRNS